VLIEGAGLGLEAAVKAHGWLRSFGPRLLAIGVTVG
jgi:hypothetical protein